MNEVMEDAGEEDQLEGSEAEVTPHLDTGSTPTGLKEISSLASWTVSSSKFGHGITALRSSDTSQFWQSDGPQPHYLTLHFFRLVSIVHVRIFLDFEVDESYTPTKMQFWAGMGVHDMQQFAEMSFEQPKGWIDVDFSKVGPLPDSLMNGVEDVVEWSKRPVLRAFILQVRIVENHQNGKDTHLRGLQIFAVDPTADKSARGATSPTKTTNVTSVRKQPTAHRLAENVITKAPWMLEAELR